MAMVRSHSVASGSITIWWLGQGGFLFKSPAGALIAIDPYLSDSCGRVGDETGINCHRMFPPPFEPADLVGIDLYVLTHSHQDHLDPDTLNAYRSAGGAGPYLAPAETVQTLRSWDVPAKQVIMTWPNHTHQVRDLTLRATFAIPFAGDDLTHVGYLIKVANGPTVYMTGDTSYHEILATSLVMHSPDVLLTAINGTYRNLSTGEAAKLAKQHDPRIVIPYHFGLLPDNTALPAMLRTNLMVEGISDRYRLLETVKPYTYPEP